MRKVRLISINVYYEDGCDDLESRNIKVRNLYGKGISDHEVDALMHDLITKIDIMERRSRDAKIYP